MKTLFCLLLIFPTFAWSEEPPEPEYPYPKKVKSRPTLEVPTKIGPNGTYFYSTEKKAPAKTGIEGIEKPVRIGEDGSYYYGEDSKKAQEDHLGVEKPERRGEDGTYYYDPEIKPKKQKPRYGALPDQVLDNGTYLYNAKPIAAENILSLRLGIYGPPSVQANVAGASDFKSVYSSNPSFLFAFDYDWELYRGIDIKFGSGLMTAKGKGQFVGTANAGLTPNESFQFYVFPNTVTLSYKFKLWDIQFLTPYVDAGPGYFTFMETRSDGGKTHFGGALVLSATGGLLISLGSYNTGSEMQSDYGVNETWIDLQFRQIFGLDSRKDFSSSMITVGFAIGF